MTMWLEMSKNPIHGGGEGWGFSEALWSPSRDISGEKSGYREKMLDIEAGDYVFHLLGDENPKFVGYSIAAADGFETSQRPPSPGTYIYATSFYKVPLSDYQSFVEPIDMQTVFDFQDIPLREYFLKNKERTASNKRRLFYVIQNDTLRRQNGAYLSQVDEELATLLFDANFEIPLEQLEKPDIPEKVSTKSQSRDLSYRTGQVKFSDNVRNNYSNRFCFPDCSIADKDFLIGAHIARWAKVKKLRGYTSNGLCLCLYHDKAFEIGLFTLDPDFNIFVEGTRIRNSSFGTKYIKPYHGIPIRAGIIKPSFEALNYHWRRFNFPFGENI